MAVGARATLGYLCGDEAIELTGFYQGPKVSSRTAVNAGALLVPFYTPTGAFPLGFEGDNGLWNHADLVTLSYQSSVGSAELNYRRWDIAVNGIELLLGVRYFYDRENLNLYTNDDFFVQNVFGAFDLRKVATYSVVTRNNIVGPQVGVEYSFPCTIPCLGWLWFTGMAKGMAGPNYLERHWSLVRGDGFRGFDIAKNDIRLGQVYEVSATLDIHILERLRFRAGYTALWAVGVSNPAYQFEFNLAAQGIRPAESNSSFWHGPIAEIQFLW
jgi:hypothetical protein